MLLHHLRSRLRPTCWLAILAMLMLVFGPTLSHGAASVPRADAYAADLCSMTGVAMTSMAMDGVATRATADHGAPASPSAHHDGHCVDCTQPGSALAMPVAPVAVLPLRVASALAPAQASDAPRRSHAWLGAPPRGPPAD